MTNPKTVLITGTSSGFGYLTAQDLAEKGYKVYATMRGVARKNAEAAKSLTASNALINVLELDVTDEQSILTAVGQIVANGDQIDVLVNNAGVMNIGLTEAFTIDQLHAQMDVNYYGVARMFRAVLPVMRQQGSGLVVTVSSIAGRLVFPAFHSYNSSKFAVEALAEGYRYELSQYGIDSVIVEPGPFETSIVGNQITPNDTDVLASYGEFADMPTQVINSFDEFMSENKDGDTNPKIVVDDIVALIETPFGQRPLRTVSGIDHGVRDLNKLYAEFQQNILETMEMEQLDPNYRSQQQEVA